MTTPTKTDAQPGAPLPHASQGTDQSVTRKEFADLQDRVDSLEDGLKHLGKSTRAEVKALSREVAKEDPVTVHDAIVRVKQDGCTLVGLELRAFAIKSYPKVAKKPKPA